MEKLYLLLKLLVVRVFIKTEKPIYPNSQECEEVWL